MLFVNRIICIQIKLCECLYCRVIKKPRSKTLIFSEANLQLRHITYSPENNLALKTRIHDL